MVVKLCQSSEAKTISKPMRVLQEFYILFYSIFKAATATKAKKHRQWCYYQISILLFKSSSESVRRIISSFIEYYYLSKALNTLPLLIYQHLNYLQRQQSNVLHPKSINAA
jgi:hypothetical protein